MDSLEKLLHDNMTALGAPEYTEEEWEFAKALKQTYTAYGLPSLAAEYDREAKALVEKITEGGSRALNDFVAPLWTGNAFGAGSTDVGDVSWLTPTAQCNTLCFTAGAPGHSWQNVSVGKTSIGHKGLLFAAKVIAATAVELYESPELVRKAREEFLEATAGGYFCPIPPEEYAKAVEI